MTNDELRWTPVGDLGDPQLNREVNKITAQLDTSPPAWWWLSFCDTTRPAGSQFLGVCMVEARNEPMALSRAWELGINPGARWPSMDRWRPTRFHPNSRGRAAVASRDRRGEPCD